MAKRAFFASLCYSIILIIMMSTSASASPAVPALAGLVVGVVAGRFSRRKVRFAKMRGSGIVFQPQLDGLVSQQSLSHFCRGLARYET